MEWINNCDVRYNPEDGQYYIIYLNNGGMELAAYNSARKSFVEIHYGEEYSEDSVSFIASITNPWLELTNDIDGNT